MWEALRQVTPKLVALTHGIPIPKLLANLPLDPMEPDNSSEARLYSTSSDVPLKENKVTENLSEHCDGSAGDLRKKTSLNETVHEQHGYYSRVNLKRIDKQAFIASCSDEGAGDARIISRPPSPIASPDRCGTVPFDDDDDDYIPEELKYSSADNSTVVADITNESDTAWGGVILDCSGAATDMATSLKVDGSFESAEEAWRMKDETLDVVVKQSADHLNFQKSCINYCCGT